MEPPDAVMDVATLLLTSALTLGSRWTIRSEVLDLRDLRLRLFAGGAASEPSASSTTSRLVDIRRVALPAPASVACPCDLLFLLGGLSVLS